MANVLFGTKKVPTGTKVPDFLVQYGTQIGSIPCPAGGTIFGSILDTYAMPIWNQNSSMESSFTDFQFLSITFMLCYLEKEITKG